MSFNKYTEISETLSDLPFPSCGVPIPITIQRPFKFQFLFPFPGTPLVSVSKPTVQFLLDLLQHRMSYNIQSHIRDVNVVATVIVTMATTSSISSCNMMMHLNKFVISCHLLSYGGWYLTFLRFTAMY